jgi:hypothetical protein
MSGASTRRLRSASAPRRLLPGSRRPAIAGSPNPDAGLIALCDLFTQNEAKQASLYVTTRDDDERDVALEPLTEEWRALIDQIEQIEGPTTMAGARAMARAALATTPRGCDGAPKVGCDPEDWFHICIARFLTGSAAA